MDVGAAGEGSAGVEPGVGSVLSRGWTVLKGNFGPLVGVGLVFVLVQAIANAFTVEVGPNGQVDVVSAGLATAGGTLYSVLVVGPVTVGTAWAALRSVRGDEPALGDVLEGCSDYGSAVLGMLAAVATVLVGLILFVIPGVVALVRLAFVPFLIADEGLAPREALEASWEATSGHGWRLFGLGLAWIGLALGGLLLLVVGIVPATMWGWVALAAYYESLTGPTGEPRPAAGA